MTHSLTGLAMARAGLNRICPHASWILVLAANVPDFDAVVAAGGSLSYLTYHRHLTHAWIALPLLAFVPVLLVRLFSRQPLRWGPAWLISCAGIASHLMLDFTNVYGIRLLLPFSATWYRADITPVIDPWIWAVFLLSVAAPALARLVNSEIGASPRIHPGRGFAIFALSFLLLYNGARAVLHERAVATLDAHSYQGGTPLRVAAFPDVVNPLRWRGVVEGDTFYSIHPVDLLREFDPSAGVVFRKAEMGPAVAAAAKSKVFRRFAEFAQFPIWSVTPLSGGASKVELLDLRFGTPRDPGFAATAVVDREQRVLEPEFHFGRAAPR
ncbi:MAG: metal-dependent hydrolase [Bryobacteraceae bacterium]